MSRFIAVFSSDATSDQVSAAVNALTSNGASILQAWDSYALVADGEQQAQDAARGCGGVALISGGSVDQPELLGLSDDALTFVRAWNVRQSDAYQGAVSEFLGTTVSWSDILPPDGCFVYGGSSDGGGSGDGGSSAPAGGDGSLIASTNGATNGSSNGAQPQSGSASGSPPQAGSPSPVGSPAASGGATTAVALKTPSARAMVGTIAVGILIVDGPDGSAAAFASDERTNCILAASHAFDALYGIAPMPASHLVFGASVKTAKLDVDPTTIAAPPAAGTKLTSSDYETRESAWRDPALAKLGYGSGTAGVKSFCADVKASNPMGMTPDWAYVLVFTKYSAAWMAYGNDLNNPVYIVVQYQQVTDKTHGGWGVEKMHMVIAHESGHMTGAPDEYASSSCTLGGKFGFAHSANPNCENGNASPVDCLMRNNKAAVCTATHGQFGWDDSNGDGVLDPYDSTYVRP